MELARDSGEKRTQDWLAEKVGVPKWTVAKWETGKQKPTGENLLRLAAALGVSPEWLLRGPAGAFEAELNKSLEGEGLERTVADEGYARADLQIGKVSVEVKSGPEESGEVSPDPAVRLASLLADQGALPDLLARLPVGDVLASVYAIAAESRWPEGALRELDAASIGMLRHSAGATAVSPGAAAASLLEVNRIADQVARILGVVPPARTPGEQRRRPRHAVARRGA